MERAFQPETCGYLVPVSGPEWTTPYYPARLPYLEILHNNSKDFRFENDKLSQLPVVPIPSIIRISYPSFRKLQLSFFSNALSSFVQIR